MALLESEFKKKKRKRDAAIYREFKRLSANKENQLCRIYDVLGEKYPNLSNGNPLSRPQVIDIINEQRAKEKFYGDDEGRAE